MKWILMMLFLIGATPIHNKYDTEQKINDEFRNIVDNTQGIQHKIFVTTPTLSDMQNGEIVIISTGSDQRLLWRSSQEIYAVVGSCITVVR